MKLSVAVGMFLETVDYYGKQTATGKENSNPLIADSLLKTIRFRSIKQRDPTKDIISKLPPSIAITPDLPIEEPEDSLIMGDEHLSTIPEKESDEFIKSSVEDLVLIPSESEDISGSDSDCNLPSCDEFSPINDYEEKSITFSNPLFDSNDNFTSSDDKSLSDEDVPEDNVKIYSNPLFEFDDEYIFSDVNPLFDEVLEDIECKVSYDSNLDEPALLVTPLSDFNEDECFDPGSDVDEIEFLLHRDPSTPTISVVSILEGFTDEPPLEENDELFDLESKGNEWKKILYDAPINDLMTEDKVFDPGIHETIFSPTYVSLPFEDRHYLSFTYVIRIFFTYPVDSFLPLSSESEDCAVKTVSSVKPNVTQAVRSQAIKVTDHLIKDCDFYDQKGLEPRVKNVVNTRKRVVKPVWELMQKYCARISLVTVRPANTVRPVSTARLLVSKIAQSDSVIRPNHPRFDIGNPEILLHDQARGGIVVALAI
ncbi:hypothetical protein Tco_1132851 [Tanacetum coccineum]|uniref:Uncharacterized protein n=1 Tax=Tanacetum coccineum TaxID=301880 RepID=A0ABQ5JD43_9ASTR